MRKLITIFIALLGLAACSEDDRPDNFEPQLHIGEARDIARTVATITGRIVVFGNTPVPELAFVYNAENDTLQASPAVVPDAEGHVSAQLTGLKPGTPYTVFLRADNGRVTLTSDTLNFVTMPEEIPRLHVSAATGITRTEATLTGRIVKEEETPMPELRFVYARQDGTDSSPLDVEADSEGRVSVRLTGLEAGTSYRFCLQGDNGKTTLGSDTLAFTTLPEDVPQLHVGTARDITRTEATLTGRIVKEEETPMPELRFVYARQEGTDSSPLDVEADSEGRVSVRLTGLEAGTSYRFCLQGDNGKTTLSSDTLAFATLPDEPPAMGQSALVSLGPVSAIVSYEILSEGSEEVTESGCYVSRLPSGQPQKIQASATTGTCQLHIGGLERNSTYQIQPYAASKVGETKGQALEISTSDAVVWKEPGGLSALMGEDLYRFTSLSFAGPMDGDDLRLLRRMMGRNADGTATNGQLSHVNLIDADIVDGGESYDNAHYTQEQVIGQGLFAGCDRLEEVALPNSAVSIEKDAFLGCSSLVRLELPVYTEKVLPSDGCTELAEISISPANTHYRSIDGVLFNAGASEIVWFPMGKSGDYALPATATSIGDYAFRGCHITKFILPDGLKELGQGVFYGSTVEEVATPATLRAIPTATFQACTRLSCIRLGSGTELISDYAFDSCPLEHLYVEAAYPPVCHPDAFTTSHAGLFSTCTLHVPAGSVNRYKADRNWGQFEHIIGIDQ